MLLCSIAFSASVKKKDEQFNKEPRSGDSSTKDASETGSVTSSAASTDNATKLQQSYLEVVYGLSSDVSLKKNSMALNV